MQIANFIRFDPNAAESVAETSHYILQYASCEVVWQPPHVELLLLVQVVNVVYY